MNRTVQALAIVFLPGGALVAAGLALACWWWRAREDDRMTRAWLDAQERREWRRGLADSASRRGIDGVSWHWPINKIVNEHGPFNRVRLRSDASERSIA